MQKILGENYDDVQRVNFLKDNCDSVEEKGYMKPFTPEAILAMKDNLAESSILLNDIQEEMKDVMKGFKDQIAPILKEKKTLLGNIKTKAVFVKENCYKFIDKEDKMTGFYSASGLLIESRPSTPDEMQGTIFQMTRKTGTNN